MPIGTNPSNLLPRAAFRPGPSFHYAKDQEQAGDPPATPPVTPPAQSPAAPQQPDKGKPGDDDIEKRANERAQAILAQEREKERVKAEKAQREKDEEEAKKRGEFETLLAKAKAEKEEAALALRKEQVGIRLRDFLAANHPDYAAAAKYMTPLLTVKADTEDADADKQIKAVVEAYVKDNPRTTKPVGAPNSPAHGTRLPAAEKPGQRANGQPAAGVATRYF